MADITIQDVRAKYPQYSDMSDQQLADALHSKYYSDMPKNQFYSRIGLKTPQVSGRKEWTGPVEAAASMIESSALKPVSDIAGLADIPLHYLGISKTEPADVQSKIQSLAVQPETKTGKALLGVASLPFQAISAGANWLGNKAEQYTGSKSIGRAVTAAAEQAPAFLGLRGKSLSELSAEQKAFSNKPEIQTYEEGRQHGYVATPTAVRAKGPAMILEGITSKGKIEAATSVKNAEARSNDIAVNDFGLPEGTNITPQVLSDIRATAGEKYQAVINSVPVSTVTPEFVKSANQLVKDYSGLKEKFPSIVSGPTGKELKQVVDGFKEGGQFSTSDLIDLVKELRHQADSNLSVAPGVKIEPGKAKLGKFQYNLAQSIDDMIDQNVSKSGNADAITQYRDARKTIAKTYAVQGALNPFTGEIEGPKLALMNKRGNYTFTGALGRAAKHAQAFPKDNKSLSRIGGHPFISPWDFLLAGGSALSGHLGVAASELAGRVSAAPLLSSKMFQERFVRSHLKPDLSATRMAIRSGIRTGAAIAQQQPAVQARKDWQERQKNKKKIRQEY